MGISSPLIHWVKVESGYLDKGGWVHCLIIAGWVHCLIVAGWVHCWIIANWAHDFQLTWSIWLILWGTFYALLAIFQPYNGSPCSSPESSSPESRFTRLFLIEIYVYPSSVVFLIFFHISIVFFRTKWPISFKPGTKQEYSSCF